MNIKWFGAALVISGCGGFGLLMASGYRREIRAVKGLQRAVEYMICQLQYSMMPLPELIDQMAGQTGGILANLFRDLRFELESQHRPDILSCMYCVIHKYPELPSGVRGILLQMGRTLGQFDLPGQIRELESLLETCKKASERLESQGPQRLKSYQTLGLCTGAALAIILL